MLSFVTCIVYQRIETRCVWTPHARLINQKSKWRNNYLNPRTIVRRDDDRTGHNTLSTIDETSLKINDIREKFCMEKKMIFFIQTIFLSLYHQGNPCLPWITCKTVFCIQSCFIYMLYDNIYDCGISLFIYLHVSIFVGLY